MSITKRTEAELAGTGLSQQHGGGGGNKAYLDEIVDAINALQVLVAGMDTPGEFPYTPDDETDWPDPDPVNLQEGLDKLAARTTVNDTHTAGDGSDHADVGTNSSHTAGDGSDHADVATNTAAIAAIVDDHVRAICTGMAIQTDENEVSGALSGDVANAFSPAEIVLVVTEVTGAVAGDGTVNIGTSADGAEILSAQALTGLSVAGDVRRIPLPEAAATILANATLYANVEAADSTVTTMAITAYVLGRQFSF